VRAVLIGLASLMLALPGAVHAVGEPVLVGTVGPDTTITFEAGGAPVTTLVPGTYDIVVHDLSTAHNFHLSGPGVDKATEVLRPSATRHGRTSCSRAGPPTRTSATRTRTS
jgi:hypothetical protein